MPIQLSGSLAITGSLTTSTTIGAQGAINTTNATNPISFTSTASLYTDGGIRVTKDMYVSGTSYFNNVTVYGTQSIQYITSSQLNISTNIISVNTDTPAIRFGGLSVYDSGSTGLTGSMLWDSEANHWVYTNPSGSTYSGGMLISGPRSSALGSEQGTTLNALMKGQGGDHITSSGVFESGSNIGIGTSSPTYKLDVQGTGRFTGTLNAESNITFAGYIRPSSNVGYGVKSSNGTVLQEWYDGATYNYGTFINSLSITAGGSSLFNAGSGTLSADILTVRGGGGTGNFGFKIEANNGEDIFYTDNFTYNVIANPVGGKFGIGTTSPEGKLTIQGTSAQPPTSGTTANSLLQLVGSLNNQLNIGSNTVTGDYGSYIQASDNNLAVPYPLNLQPNGGNVGIGTSTPGRTLHILGQSGIGTVLKLEGASGTTTYLQLAYNGATNAQSGYIGYDSSANMPFFTSNTERMRITSGGNVGIGTTSPNTPLSLVGDHVSGYSTLKIQSITSYASSGLSSLGFMDSDGARKAIIYTNSDGLQLETTPATPILFNTNGNTKMVLTSGGNVGIGNTSPTAYGAYTTVHIGSASSIGLIKLGTGASANGPEIFTNSSNTIVFNSSNTDTRLVILGNNGNVGIGTTSPASRLHIDNSSGSDILRLSSTSVNTRYVYTITGGATDPFTLRRNHINNGDLDIMTWDYNGRVGIGTTSPSARLSLGTGIGAKFLVYDNPSTGVYSGLGQDLAAGDSIDLFAHGLSNYGFITFGKLGTDKSTYTEWMRINPSGNVGIGTTSPGSLLQVGGSGAVASAAPTAIQLDNSYRNAVGGNTALKFYLYRSSNETYGIGLNNAGGIEYHSGLAGDAGSYQAFYFGNSEKIRFKGDGTIQPGANGTQDLGTSSLRWATVYTSDLDMSNGIGDYTIVEGEEDLFLYNNKTNKVFKFVIQEVDPSTAPPKKVK